MTDPMHSWSLGVALVLAIMASAIAGVYVKHESRKLFTEVQVLKSERDTMEVEWGQLQIELGTWSTYARVEQLAREEMHMRTPKPEQMRLLVRRESLDEE